MSKGLAIFLAIMAGLCLLIANFALWLGGSIFNEEVFSKTAVTVVQTKPVRDAVSEEIVDKALQEVPELRGPVATSLEGVISGFLAGKTARPVLAGLADGVNESLTGVSPTAVKLDLRRMIRQLQPFITRINRDFDVNITTTDVPKQIVILKKGEIPSIYGWGVPFLWFGPISGLAGLALLIVSIAFAGPGRWFVLQANGVVLTVSALLFRLMLQFAETPLSASIQSDNARVLTLKLFKAFSGQLAYQTWILAGAGLLLAAAGFILPLLVKTPPAEKPSERQAA